VALKTTTFPFETGEHILGQWSVDYVAPSGCRVPGHLAVTGRRVLFAGPAGADCWQKYLVGPVDAAAVAYALDLDTEHVRYEDERLFFAIPKAHVEDITTDHALINHAICIKLKNNGSIQTFERHLLPVGAMARAIQTTDEGTS
jgi:hypothetical protein